MGGLRIVKVGADRIADFEPLWASLHEHQRTVDPGIEGIPPRDLADSWPRRRVKYEEWLAEPGAFALLFEDGGVPIAYAVVTMHEPADDTHVTKERWAELQSLAVLPAHREGGLGTQLMDRVYQELREMDISELLIMVIATNERALRFYERQGFKPWVVMTLGKVPPANPGREDPARP